MERKKAYADGGGKGDIAIVLPDGKTILNRVEVKTNNEAEYRAVIYLLENIKKGSKLTILSDSQLVIRQINGRYVINHQHLQDLYDRVIVLVKEKNLDVVFEWVSREENPAGKALERLKMRVSNLTPEPSI